MFSNSKLCALENEVSTLRNKIHLQNDAIYTMRSSIREANKQTASEMLDAVNRFVNTEEFLDKNHC